MSATKIRLVALDMDGTTLNSHHELTDYTISVLRRLSAKGVIIAFATGRSIPTIESYVAALDLPQAILPAVCYNGAIGIIIDKDNNRSIIVDNQVTKDSAKLVIDFSIRNQFVAHVSVCFFVLQLMILCCSTTMQSMVKYTRSLHLKIIMPCWTDMLAW